MTYAEFAKRVVEGADRIAKIHQEKLGLNDGK